MEIPLYVYVIDYVLGVVMYTLIGRSAMNIFQKEDSEFFFMKAFVKLTNPVLDMFKFLTPSFLVRGVVPLYICLLYTSPSPRDGLLSRMPSSA